MLRFVRSFSSGRRLLQSELYSKFEPKPNRRSQRRRLLNSNKISSTQQLQQQLLTKIVCTLGPATNNATILSAMMKNGMTVARINFSHGTHDEHREQFQLIRSVAEQLELPVAIMCDIQGPKIRLGQMKDKTVQLNVGDLIRVTPKEVEGTRERITVRIPTLLQDLGVGDQIFINDGIVELKVQAVEPEDLVCVVRSGGLISAKKGCNLPSTKVHVDIMTEKDRKDLALIAELNPEFVAASFVGSGQDIAIIRQVLRDHGNDQIQIVAKIERPLALKNMDEIIKFSDACMVARGDLGVEIPAHQVPVAQMEIVRSCNIHSRPVIIATQMLESMTNNSRPTRAEASDVFNAVVGGADAVMLSGETSVGKYAVETVHCMAQIAQTAQSLLPERDPDDFRCTDEELTETIGSQVFNLSREFMGNSIHGKIVVLTESGFAARMVSKFRPSMPICAVVTSDRVARELALVWGINTVCNIRLTTLFRKHKHRALIKQLCYQKVIGQHEIVILVQTTGPHATLGVYDVDEIMHETTAGDDVDLVRE